MDSKIKAVVLDFDGTIFRLFANTDLSSTVIELYDYLSKYNIDFSLNNDAFDAFKIVYDCNISNKEEILFEINRIITKKEVDAIEEGILIDGFFEFVDYLYQKNLKVIIASNNSIDCISRFLCKYKLNNIDIIGRIPNRPDLMKPNTYMLYESVKRLNCNKEDIVFVGDNIRDYECANEFRCKFIALTSTKNKRKRILNKIPNVNAVDNFFELIKVLDKNYL